jgi:hypothetical protein
MKLYTYAFIFFLFVFSHVHAGDYPTYFKYDESELKRLADQTSNGVMTDSELVFWDEIAKELSLNQSETIGADFPRMLAYLYTAQRDAALLSYRAHGKFMGSLGPVSSNVLKMFFTSVPSPEVMCTLRNSLKS